MREKKSKSTKTAANKRQLLDTKKPSKWGFLTRYKKPFLIIWTVVCCLFLMVSGLMIYLHQGRFQVAFNQRSLSTYLQEDIGIIMTIDGYRLTVHVPEDVLSTLFNARVQGLLLSDNQVVIDGYMDTANGKAYVNTFGRGLHIPIAMEALFKTTDRSIYLTFGQMQLRDKKVLSLPQFMENKIRDRWHKYQEALKITLDDFDLPEIVIVEQVALVEDGLTLTLKVKEDALNKEMTALRALRSKELYTIYQQKEGIEGQARELMGKSGLLTDEEADMLLEDILYKESQLLKHIFIIADEEKMEPIFRRYGKYLSRLDEDAIIQDKYRLILGKIEGYCRSLLEALEALPKEQYIVFGGKPYNLEEEAYLGTSQIIEVQTLDIPEDISQRLDLFYDYDRSAYATVYQVDEDTFAIVGGDYYDIVTKEAYQGYSFEAPAETQETVDRDAVKAAEAFFQMKVFVRYMNTDGQYAYAIVSPEESYQDYERLALEKKEGAWQVVDTGISDLYGFSIKHPGFNIHTITDKEIVDKIYALSSKDIGIIRDQLIHRKIMDPEDTSIVYCSFDGDYIALRLSNGEEYVLNIRYAYLDKVYKKEVAITKWKDISPLILLQDYEEEAVPEEEESTEDEQPSTEDE